jgi:ubiquinone/menaquinone biosynthesis C-methylase UbiE
MRAVTQISVPAAPDYALRVPAQFQFLVGAGFVGGLVGLTLLLGAPTVPALIGSVLLVAAVVSAAFVLAIATITSPRRRERARREMLEAVAWRGDEHVLDVGCGNGFLVNEIAKRLTDGRAVGIDMWKTDAGQQASDVAMCNAQLEGVADRVEIRNADARSMPFEDWTFDVIVSSLMLHHAGSNADRSQVLAEMVRVLRPGGTILLYDVSPLISAAIRRLTSSGLAQIVRSGRVMALVAATRPPLRNAA